MGLLLAFMVFGSLAVALRGYAISQRAAQEIERRGSGGERRPTAGVPRD